MDIDVKNPIKDKYAIVGIGSTDYSWNSGRTVISLAAEASKKAIDDAGLKPEDIDGVITHHYNDSVSPQDVAGILGLPGLRYFIEFGLGGGQVCAQLVGTAAMAIECGMAKNVLYYRARNGRSQARLGGMGRKSSTTLDSQFLTPYGLTTFGAGISVAASRQVTKYGTKLEHFGEIPIAARKWASMNEKAQLRDKPLTMEQYLNTPFMTWPLRRYDFCLETDGACAIVISSAEKAKDLKHRPVYITAVEHAGGPSPSGFTAHALVFWRWPDHADFSSKYVAQRLYKKAGLGPKDFDFVELYDEHSPAVIWQLEGYGFCKEGEGGPFVEGGGIAPGGRLPVNTHGGLLAEAYFHNLNHFVEATIQLRGDAGKRQVKDAEIGLVTSFGFTVGCAAVLRR